MCFDWLSERVQWTHSGFPALVAQEKVLFLVIIINPLLTRFVRSKWLNIGLVLFSVFIDLDFVSAHNREHRTSTGIRLFAFFFALILRQIFSLGVKTNLVAYGERKKTTLLVDVEAQKRLCLSS